MRVILTKQSKFGNAAVAVTNGTGGTALANRSNDTVLLPILPDIKQIDSIGADDACFGGITSRIEEMEIIGNIVRVSCEIIGGLPLFENYQIKNRMIVLNRYNINTKNLQFKMKKLIEKYCISSINTGDNDNNNNNMLKQFKIKMPNVSIATNN